ncbi:MAG: hypothetical protein IPK58_20060 [Acidobacteria bacterium]|nr:hypothetical protein [Acidobacteriota bacterium]
MSAKKVTEADKRDFVPTNDSVNAVLSRYQSATYTNEVNAQSATQAVNEAKGKGTVKEVELGISIDYGLKGGSPNASVGGSIAVKVEVTNTHDIEVQRQIADDKLQISAMNELRGIKTVATGSGGAERFLTVNEIGGIIRSARLEAVQVARADVQTARDNRRATDRP